MEQRGAHEGGGRAEGVGAPPYLMPSVIDAPSGGAPEKAPRWDLTGTEGCGGGIRFSWMPLMVGGYVGIYRRKKYVGGATWAP